MTTQTPISEEELREQVESELVKQRNLVEEGHLIMSPEEVRNSRWRSKVTQSFFNIDSPFYHLEERISELTQTNKEDE